MLKGEGEIRFKRHEKVVAAVDLPGVPAGTRGKVLLVNGFRWIRYWVLFKNGAELGQLNGDQLTTREHWEEAGRQSARRHRAAEAEQRRQEHLAAMGQPQS